MKRILLTTTSLVLAAGVANADVTLAWSGAATVGVAREGGSDGAAAAAGTNGAAATAIAVTAAAADAEDGLEDQLVAISTVANTAAGTLITLVADTGGETAAAVAADIATLRDEIAQARITIAAAIAAEAADPDGSTTVAAAIGGVAGLVFNGVDGTGDVVLAAIDSLEAALNSLVGSATAAVATGDFETYSEVNATVVGTASMDNGMSLSASVSVDAGKGYDFADDDGFDAAKTNGVSLDNVTLSMGSLGTLVIDENAVAHLVDDDDDEAADLLYTNTVGAASVSLAVDISADTDGAAARATEGTWNAAGLVYTDGAAAAAADVAWSASVSMPLAGGSVNAAMDEEGGNSFGASGSIAGITLGFTSALEALEEELNEDRSNTVSASYAMGAVTMGASWNSLEDGDQWGISAGYAADGVSISASTDEGSDWAVSGSMDLGGGASVVAGTNYTEDAYVGMSFAF